MLYILAIICPGLAVLFCGKPITAVLLILVQITIIGWVIGVIVAWVIISNTNADRRDKRNTSRIVIAIKEGHKAP